MIDSDSSSSSCTSGNEDSQSQSQHEAKLQIEIMQRDKNKIPQDVYGLIHNISPSNITGSSGISFDGIRSISTDQNANYSFNQNNDGHTSTSSNLQMPISASTSNAQIPEYPKQDNPQVNPTRLTDSNDRDTITKSPGQHNSPSRITKHDGHRKGPRCKKPKMKYCKHNISGGRRNFLNNIFIISNCCDKCKVMLNSNLCHHSHTDMNTNNDVLQSRKSNENPSHNSHSTESVENYPNQIPDETYYNSSDQSDNQPSFNPSDRQSTGISTDAGLVSHQLPNAMLTSNRTTSKDECNRNLLPQNSPDPLLGCMFQSNEFVSEDRNRYLHSAIPQEYDEASLAVRNLNDFDTYSYYSPEINHCNCQSINQYNSQMRYNQKQSNNFNHELLAANEQHCKYRTARNCICSQMKLLNVNSKKTQALDNIKEYLLETNECPSYSNNVRLDKYNESNSNQLERMWPRRESEFKQTSHTNVQGNNSQIDPHIYSESLQNHGLTSTNLLKSDQATSDERYNSSTTFDSAASGCCSSYSKPYQKKYALIELNDIEMDTSICNQERQRKKSTQNLSCMSYLQDDSQLTQILNHLFSDDDLQ